MSRLHNKDIVWSLILEYSGWLVRCLGKGLERKTTIKHKHKLHKTLPPTASWSHSNNQLSLIWNTYQRYRWSILWNDPYVAEMISSRWFWQKSNLISNVFIRNCKNTQTDIYNYTQPSCQLYTQKNHRIKQTFHVYIVQLWFSKLNIDVVWLVILLYFWGEPWYCCSSH